MMRGRSVCAFTASFGLFAALGAIPDAQSSGQNKPTDWVSYDSRETKRGPELTLTCDDGESVSLSAAADATVIAYLADRSWGQLPFLAIDLTDTNRVLLRFEVPAAKKVRKAELLLRLSGGDRPAPSQPFDVSFFSIKEAWDENDVTWKSQPSTSDKPLLTVPVDPKVKELRIDVTKLILAEKSKKTPHHGWLIKVARPLHRAVAPGQGSELESTLLKLLPWEKSVPDALRKARTDKKLVLACVRPSLDAEKPTFSELMLLATALADPDVRDLIRARFVLVRVNYSPISYILSREVQDRDIDPLSTLGTSVRDTKALALVVSTGDGTALTSLKSIGTFDRDLILRFLLGAVAKSGASVSEKAPWQLLRRGDLAEAERLFTQMDSTEGTYGLSRVASYRGEHETALRTAQKLVAREGDYHQEATVGTGFALLRLGRYAEAEKMLDEKAAQSGARAAEATYYRGCLLYRAREFDRARTTWEALKSKHPDSPFAAKAKARLDWPEAMAIYENLAAVNLPRDVEQTERDRSSEEEKLVQQGIDYLLGQQRPDGSWPVADQDSHRVAITALVARSLHLWSTVISGDHKEKTLAAAARATVWLNRQLSEVDPKTMDSFGAAYLLDYFLDLEQTKAQTRGDVPRAIRLLISGQCPNGGWSYSYRFGVSWKGGFGGWPQTDKGRVHSINTGPAMLALARAKERGYTIDAQALTKGRRMLEAMRDGPGVYTYTYPEPRCFNKPDSSIGRASVCEHALRCLGASTREDMETTIELFLKYGSDLRVPVKLSESWLPPRGYSSYFYFYAYDHAARAIVDHGKAVRTRLDQLRVDLLRVAEVDGTWVDYEALGKPYGTAMALHVLFLARQAALGKP